MKLPLVVIGLFVCVLAPAAYAMEDRTGHSFAGCGQVTALKDEEVRILMPGNDEFVINGESSAYEKESYAGGTRYQEIVGSKILADYQEGQCLCISGAMKNGAPLFRMRSYVKTYNPSLIFRHFPVSCSRQKQAVIQYTRDVSTSDSAGCGDLGCLGGGFGHM